MIYERSIFIFTCAVSSVLLTCAGSKTAESKNIVSESVINPQMYLWKTNQIRDRQKYLQNTFDDSLYIVAQESASPASPASPLINKRWTGIGMVVTSVLFVALLWVLFQKGSEDKIETALTDLSTTEDLNTFDLLESYGETTELESNVPSLISQSEEYPQKDPAKMTLAETALYLEKRSVSPNVTVDEDPQNVFQDTAIHMAGEENSVEINAENQGMVKIKTSNTTEIDVVFELIQDLQKSDLRLRRKAIWELASVGDSRSIEPLISIMSQANALDKSLILSAITQIAHRNFESIYNVLFASLKDENSEVRKDAIRDITALHKPTSLVSQRLVETLKDSDEEVRQTAEWALKKINSGFSVTKTYTANGKGVVSSNGK